MNTSEFEERPIQKADTVRNQNCANKNSPDHLFIKIQDHFRRISFSNILYVEASGSYCNFYLQVGSKVTVAYTLTEVMQHLPDNLFIRVHRSFIINREHVSSYIGNVFYIGEQMIPIGRQYKKNAFSHFNVLGTIG